MQGVQVWSLIGELRYHMPCSTAPQKKGLKRHFIEQVQDQKIRAVKWADISEGQTLSVSPSAIYPWSLAIYDDDGSDETFIEHGIWPDPVLSTAHELTGLILTTTQYRSSLYPFSDEETEAQTDCAARR